MRLIKLCLVYLLNIALSFAAIILFIMHHKCMIAAMDEKQYAQTEVVRYAIYQPILFLVSSQRSQSHIFNVATNSNVTVTANTKNLGEA